MTTSKEKVLRRFPQAYVESYQEGWGVCTGGANNRCLPQHVGELPQTIEEAWNAAARAIATGWCQFML